MWSVEFGMSAKPLEATWWMDDFALNHFAFRPRGAAWRPRVVVGRQGVTTEVGVGAKSLGAK
jgi:hypothetical protein